MLTRFHSAVVDVEDFDEAVQHYSRLLGREPASSGVNRARGSRNALFPLTNLTLELRAPATGKKTREGLAGIRLGIDDADAVAAALDARQVEVVESSRESIEDASGRPLREWDRLLIDPLSSRGIEVELVRDASLDPLPTAPPSVDSRAGISGLDHVVVFSTAPDSTRAFYGEGLGIRLALDRSFEERRVRLLFFRMGGVTIEIGSRLGAPVDEGSSDRFGGLAWQVEDVDQIRERLLTEDFDVSEVRSGNKAGTRVCTVRSPVHGVPTLLIQPISR